MPSSHVQVAGFASMLLALRGKVLRPLAREAGLEKIPV